MAVAEKLKVAELMAEASFIQKRREAELQAEALKVEQELAKAQARVRVLDKENKVDQSKAVISSRSERAKKVWLKEEMQKHISPDNSKDHDGIRNCNTFSDTAAENLLHQSRDKKITNLTSACANMEILLIYSAHLLENKQLHKLLLNPLMEIH